MSPPIKIGTGSLWAARGVRCKDFSEELKFKVYQAVKGYQMARLGT